MDLDGTFLPEPEESLVFPLLRAPVSKALLYSWWSGQSPAVSSSWGASCLSSLIATKTVYLPECLGLKLH